MAAPHGSARGLAARLVRALSRDAGLPPAELVRKLARSTAALLVARVALRSCDRVGARARVFGRPHVASRGTIEIGDDFALSSAYGAALLATGPGGAIHIGDGVTINYGTTLSARWRISVGDRVKIGPFCVIADTEVPLPLDVDADPKPIEIEPDVWIGARVTIAPGAVVRRGAVISAGSVVSGVVPAHSVVAGAPARVLRVSGPRPTERTDAAAE